MKHNTFPANEPVEPTMGTFLSTEYLAIKSAEYKIHTYSQCAT
jgi:hypothetical protein